MHIQTNIYFFMKNMIVLVPCFVIGFESMIVYDLFEVFNCFWKQNFRHLFCVKRTTLLQELIIITKECRTLLLF